ncbi:tol-pal system protein YbgF [Ruegeria sp. 2205SS24-7]|uniref:tol-pal system protein YbgF n=1 Tax=Ruegeria discodermiae TaxID=3064389 RepID=UPI0027421C9C|nr:tol-pal system protein YbgF [Ruegeria sp. 2205SS24-7]MDP5218710.1 tol-pal system protein YbgF [Ruegeria sp. 2205SS24-7]
MRFGVIAFAATMLVGGSALAQDQQTLADIRQELTVLNVEIQRLKREFSTTGAPQTQTSGSTVLERVDAIEAELQRLTRLTEQLNQRVDGIVKDGTNRIGDLQFRLCELESGCDIATLPDTPTLGGDVTTPLVATPDPAPAEPGAGGTELAVGEQADFDAATKALDAQDYARAAELFAVFDTSYPGSPLAAQAHLNRGRALDGLGDTREAARAYLASFTNDSTGPTAADALYNLGASLGRLGQNSQACVTLGEVVTRFPSANAVSAANSEMSALGCT